MKHQFRKHLISLLNFLFSLSIVAFSFGLLTAILIILSDYQNINIERIINSFFVLVILLVIAFSLKYFRKKLEC